MRKNYVVISFAASAIAVAVILVAVLLNPSPAVPSARFVGYTNDASGVSQALFVITNHTTRAFDLVTGLCVVGLEQRVVSSIPFTASAMRVDPGKAVTVALPRPPTPQLVPWRAWFDFLPERPPVLYRLKIWLHRAGIRGMDMALPTVSASSGLIDSITLP